VSKCGNYPKLSKEWGEVFGGVHELSIDSKGRLAIPAKFRELLLRHYTPAVVATLDSRHRLLVYPELEWEGVAKQLLGLKVAGNPALQRYQNLLLHNADTLELDTAGRVLLPANLRRRVDFDKEVTLVGRANRLELWGREHWEAEMNQALDIDPDELAFELSKTDLQL
jgi:MraZ protein